MALEIEDKFLVTDDSWREHNVQPSFITQTYLLSTRTITIRTRLESGEPAILCIKLKARAGGTPEYEWRMPQWIAKLCSRWQSRTLRKKRTRIPWGELVIEVDEFLGSLTGLVLAEVELPKVGFPYQKPTWFGEDVSKDKRYKNALLVQFGIPAE